LESDTKMQQRISDFQSITLSHYLILITHQTTFTLDT
jgi:hypothetical protein